MGQNENGNTDKLYEGLSEEKIEGEHHLTQELYQRLEKVGDVGIQTEDVRDKNFFNRFNGLLAIISIQSLAVVSISSGIKSENLILSIVATAVYILMFISLALAIYAHFGRGFLDIGTIEDKQNEYSEILELGKDPFKIYLRDLNKLHLRRTKINDKRDKYLSLSYVLFGISLLLSIFLFTGYLFGNYLW